MRRNISKANYFPRASLTFMLVPVQPGEYKPGARFSKVPKLFGRISGDIILFLSSKRRRLEARNLAVILIFIPFTTYQKPRISGLEFYEWPFGFGKFSGLSRNGPLPYFTNIIFAFLSKELMFCITSYVLVDILTSS